MDTEKLAKLFIELSVAGLVLAVWMTGVTLWMLHHARRRRQVERRLAFEQQGRDEERVIRLWHDGQAVDAFVPEASHMSWGQRLERIRQDAGWQMPMSRVLILVVFAVIAAATLTWVVSGHWLAVIGVVCVILIGFRAYLLRCISKQTALFEKQLIEALDLGGRSLRAGHPLSGAFKLIADEIGAPVSTIFQDVIEQEALGVSLQKALFNAAQRSPSQDMKIFATSVMIQLRSGGNLAEMIDRVAWVVRERMRLGRRARVLTAEAQLSKWVLLALPIGMFALLNLINPDYMEPFFTTTLGFVMIVVAVIMLAIGAWLMNRMASLKY